MTLTADDVHSDPVPQAPAPRLPILTVLHPREHLALVVSGFVAAFGAAWYWHIVMGRPLWQATIAFILVMSVPAAVKWRADARRYGSTVAVAVALLTVQSLHGFEHAYQWYQRHIIGLPLRRSNGLLSPANSEWVHFVWNWLVLAIVLWLVVRGMRSGWAWVFLAWVVAHTLEHTYMMIRFIEVTNQLGSFGYPRITAQGMPGIFGADGWLDRNGRGNFAFVCNLPFATTASRLDTHAAWNVGETLLMIPAVHVLLRRYFAARRPGDEAVDGAEHLEAPLA